VFVNESDAGGANNLIRQLSRQCTQFLPKMVLNVLARCPEFTGRSHEGTDVAFVEHAKDSWVVIFSYPSDFTPICTTEILQFAQNQMEFERRGCRLIGISLDSAESHKRWLSDIQTISKIEVKFPVIADENECVLRALELLLETGITEPFLREKKGRNRGIPSRGLYIVDPDGIVQYVQIMPHSAGRNITEILRVLDALQFSRLQNSLGTPAGWQSGQDAVLLSTGQEEGGLQEQYGDKITERVIFPYLRFVHLKSQS